MNNETIIKLTARANELQLPASLPAEIDGFTQKKIFVATDDRFDFFSYTNDAAHCSLLAYFHAETNEFKLRQNIGLTEFCLTDFFTEDFARFKELLDAELVGAVKALLNLRGGKVNRFLREKKIDTWAYGNELPATLEGFELFIKPSAPVEVTNGAFVVINYADFAINSDFVIYYNIYTDNFSSEVRIDGAPHVIYSFDAKTLDELETKLRKNLAGELIALR